MGASTLGRRAQSSGAGSMLTGDGLSPPGAVGSTLGGGLNLGLWAQPWAVGSALGGGGLSPGTVGPLGGDVLAPAPEKGTSWSGRKVPRNVRSEGRATRGLCSPVRWSAAGPLAELRSPAARGGVGVRWVWPRSARRTGPPGPGPAVAGGRQRVHRCSSRLSAAGRATGARRRSAVAEDRLQASRKGSSHRVNVPISESLTGCLRCRGDPAWLTRGTPKSAQWHSCAPQRGHDGE